MMRSWLVRVNRGAAGMRAGVQEESEGMASHHCLP